MLHQLPCSHEHAFDTSGRRHSPDPGTLRPHGGRHAEARSPAVDLLAVPFDERTSRHVAPPQAWSGCPRHGRAPALRYRTGILAPAPTVSVCARKARPTTRASSARTGLSKPRPGSRRSPAWIPLLLAKLVGAKQNCGGLHRGLEPTSRRSQTRGHSAALPPVATTRATAPGESPTNARVRFRRACANCLPLSRRVIELGLVLLAHPASH